MLFDDRLATVLQHRAAGERAARVQFRQLLDLLCQFDAGGDPALTRAAYRRLDALTTMIPPDQQERIAGEISPRIRAPRLLAWFAGHAPRVALAALGRAALTQEQWLALIPALPMRARGLLRHRRNLPATVTGLLDQLGIQDRVLPEPVIEDAPDKTVPPPPVLELDAFASDAEPAPPRPPLGNPGDLVRRIEAFQRARDQRDAGAAAAAPRLPLGDTGSDPGAAGPAAFLFTADTEGRIDWAEGAAGPMVVGTQLTTPGALAPPPLAAAIALRRPITGAAHSIAGAEAIAGDWVVDAAPRFAPGDGRYRGTVGRFRRPAPAKANTRALHAADRVRQLLHELRTPVTAIQGFAEVIQQQTVGPVPHEYRALAAGIAGDAARMLAGFAEIERLARLEAGTQDIAAGTSDFAAIVRRQVTQLQTILSPRVSRIEASFALSAATVPLPADTAELIAWRVLGTLAAATAAGEAMRVSLTGAEGVLRLVMRLPAALAAADDVFAGGASSAAGGQPGGSLLGAGFALRLARAEARAADGDLARGTVRELVLTLPLGEARRAPDAGRRHTTAPPPAPAHPAPLAQSPGPR